MNPAPKPAKKQKSPRRPLLSEKPIKRSGKIKPKPRKPSEFRRIYGSKARVEWVKSLRCIRCRRRGHTQNHHIETGGMGRKADFDKIVEICDRCHYWLHKWGRETWESYAGINLDEAAADLQSRWLRVSGTPE